MKHEFEKKKKKKKKKKTKLALRENLGFVRWENVTRDNEF
jgi:hypothetical protein